MKILQIINTDFGFEHLLRSYCEEFTKFGHKIEVLCTKTESNKNIPKSNFRFHYFDFSRSFNIYNFFISIIKIRKEIKNINPNIIHLHTPSASIITRIGLIGLKKKFRIVYTCHAFYFSSRGNIISKFILFFLEYIASFNTNLFLFQSFADYKLSLKFFSNKKNSFVIGNGVDEKIFGHYMSEDKIKLLKKNYEFKYNKVIVINGRLVKEKGYIELIESCKTINCDILIIGYVDSNNKHAHNIKEYILKLIDAYNMKSRVHFVGYTRKVSQILKLADIFVLPTYGEGLNRSIIEAMFSSLPIVTTNITNNSELVIDNYNGFKVPVRNVNKLRDAINYLLNNDKLRKKMGERSKEIAYKKFRMSDVIKRHLTYMDLE